MIPSPYHREFSFESNEADPCSIATKVLAKEQGQAANARELGHPVIPIQC